MLRNEINYSCDMVVNLNTAENSEKFRKLKIYNAEKSCFEARFCRKDLYVCLINVFLNLDLFAKSEKKLNELFFNNLKIFFIKKHFPPKSRARFFASYFLLPCIFVFVSL